ncbi:hypothetical protein LQ938_02845 [Microbacterium sp. cx-55]|uniref:hypothetical protein n=1 Tax=Microbacterium sp. cx-55 TaxID=2875948 RepID=UPI001CBF27CA|nr:hypothetical protein [Microbacterium sp. cx-55]MBZ4486826.1 hypothetical protein [Microbacterium sp. cx-55]UGB35755.1 hypothetical protein LQ938_02845 [Microbacterium sp. cx-55]
MFAEEDLGRIFTISCDVVDVDGADSPHFISPIYAVPNEIETGDGKPTTVRMAKVVSLVVSAFGEGEIVVSLDGEEAGTVRLTARPHVLEPPDNISDLVG